MWCLFNSSTYLRAAFILKLDATKNNIVNITIILFSVTNRNVFWFWLHLDLGTLSMTSTLIDYVRASYFILSWLLPCSWGSTSLDKVAFITDWGKTPNNWRAGTENKGKIKEYKINFITAIFSLLFFFSSPSSLILPTTVFSHLLVWISTFLLLSPLSVQKLRINLTTKCLVCPFT